MQIDPNHPPAPGRDPAAVRAAAKKKTPVASIVVGVLVIVFGLYRLLGG